MTPYEQADAALLPEFRRHRIDVGDGPVQVLTAGEGPPLLMLHGDPQTHLCWHLIAPRLAERYSVVLTDLRGRGESHKPGACADHLPYSKRAMAAEQAAVMHELGHDRFGLVGHDRGGRVARRLALDFPDRVTRLAILDIVPALDFYDAVSADLAQDYYYFFFLTQPRPGPERLIAGDPQGFMREILTGLSPGPVPYHDRALSLYLQSAASEASVSAMCECFRAGFTIDRDHDRADRRSGRRIMCPTLVMWGTDGVAGRHFDMGEVWARWAPDLTLAPVPGGHFIPEEAPEDAFAALSDFFEQ
ncbi:MAG: alpha/beta hydrolase [Alphaproteobacteria bacterium]|nr:alpha/beta hydrolase [Alphaproteobacteria bacterium]